MAQYNAFTVLSALENNLDGARASLARSINTSLLPRLVDEHAALVTKLRNSQPKNNYPWSYIISWVRRKHFDRHHLPRLVELDREIAEAKACIALLGGLPKD